MSWRNAKSLDVLKSEIRTVAPGTTFWTIGDEAHKQSWSDHNPNSAGVVCAADILGNAGLDLNWLANRIVQVDPPALKYVIWQNRIWHPGYGWSHYSGQYHSHLHVSVGWGPDGRSTGPYDDTSTWGIMNMPAERMLSVGMSGSDVRTLQELLNRTGANLHVDGDFGPLTLAAVKAFQQKHGLDVDGIVGPSTWGKLKEVAAPVPAPTPGPEPTTPVLTLDDLKQYLSTTTFRLVPVE